MKDKGLLEKVRDEVKLQYEQLECWAHGWPHVWTVEYYIERIARGEKEDKVICGIAGYCHDLGRMEEERIAEASNGRVNKELGQTRDHAFLSVKPTIELLEKLGIKGKGFDDIVLAVGLHSRKDYYGNNIVAKILRDADKISGLGAWGTLRIGKFMFEMDVEAPNFEKQKDVERAAAPIMEEILKGNGGRFQGREVLEEYLRCLGYNLEWEDMMHTDSGRRIAAPFFDYTRKMQEIALSALGNF